MRIRKVKIETNLEVEVTRRINKKWKENDNLNSGRLIYESVEI